jgi:hypothetical protein
MTITKQPYRITIEHYDTKVSVEIDHSDIDLDELGTLLKSVLLAAGWSEALIDELINR